MQEDAVQIIARFLGRDRKARLVDDLLERLGGQLEAGRQLALGNHGEIVARERGELELGAPCHDRHPAFGGGEAHLAAFWQLAGDIEQGVRGNGGGAGRLDIGGDMLVDLEIKIGRHQLDGAVRRRFDQHVGEDGNGIAPLDHRLDVAQALQQGCAFDRGLHWSPPGGRP